MGLVQEAACNPAGQEPQGLLLPASRVQSSPQRSARGLDLSCQSSEGERVPLWGSPCQGVSLWLPGEGWGSDPAPRLAFGCLSPATRFDGVVWRGTQARRSCLPLLWVREEGQVLQMTGLSHSLSVCLSAPLELPVSR